MGQKKKKPLPGENGASYEETLASLIEQGRRADANDEVLAKQLPTQLTLADTILDFGMKLPDQKDLHSISFPRDAVVTVMGLFTKAHVTFHSIIVLCGQRLDRPATALSRSLFETLLNLAFLVRKRVSLNHFNDSKANPKTPVPLYGKTLKPEFRLALFNAWCLLRDDKTVDNWRRTKGLKRQGHHTRKRLTPLDKSYIDTIGPDWKKAIKNKNTCVGLNIANFAASLGLVLQRWYRSVYAADSAFVHQSDIQTFLDITEEGNFTPRIYTSAGQVSGVLHRSAMLYLGCIVEMNKRFRFGDEAVQSISEFDQHLKNWDA